MTRTLILLLALASFLAPTAKAHVSNFGDTKTVQVGPYSVLLDPQPSPLFTNSLTMITVQVVSSEGRYVSPDLNLTLVQPNATERELRIQRNAGGMASTFVFQTQGNHTLRLAVHDQNGTQAGETWLDVYPRLPVRVMAANPDQDVTAGQEAEFSVLVVNSTTSQPAPISDLEASIELWTNDHSQILQQANLTMTPSEAGRWSLTHKFQDVGMYHVRFQSQSAGFSWDDVPLLHTYATPPVEGSSAGGANATPAPGIILVLALLGGAALLRRRA